MPAAPKLELVWTNTALGPDLQNVASGAAAMNMVGTRMVVPAPSEAFANQMFEIYASEEGWKRLNEPVFTGDAMADMTREEMDAKLATVEARAETRFAELSGKIDRVMDSINAFGGRLSDELGVVKSQVAAVQSDNKWTRWTIIIALVTSLIAGIGALWVTQSNLLAAFQTGLSIHETPAAPNSRR